VLRSGVMLGLTEMTADDPLNAKADRVNLGQEGQLFYFT